MAERDPTSLGSAFVGGNFVGIDSVSVQDCSDGSSIIQHSWRAKGFASFGLALFVILPLAFVGQWFTIHALSTSLGTSMACAGVLAASILIIPFLLNQRKVTLDPNLRILRYQSRGVQNFTFTVPLDVVTESYVVTEAFLSGGEGSGINEVPLDSIRDFDNPIYRYTVVCRLQSGAETFPFATKRREDADSFADRLAVLAVS